MTNISVANITSVCKNKDNNVGFVSAQWEFNVLYHYTRDNLSVDKKRQNRYHGGDWCLLLSHFYGILLEII